METHSRAGDYTSIAAGWSWLLKRQRGARCSTFEGKGGKKECHISIMRQWFVPQKSSTLIFCRRQSQRQASCASPRVCDLHINVKVRRQMSRFLRSNQLKSRGVFRERRQVCACVCVSAGVHRQGVYCGFQTLLLSLQLLRFCGC